MGRDAEKAKRADKGLSATWRAWLLAALLIAGLVAAVFHWGDVKRFAALISTARPMWLLIAAALQLATYFGLSAQWWLTLRRGESPQPHSDLFRLTFAKHFADQVVPTAGMSGNVVLVDRLVSLGVPRGNAVAALLLQIIAYYISYAGGALWVLVVLWWKNRTSLLLVVPSLFSSWSPQAFRHSHFGYTVGGRSAFHAGWHDGRKRAISSNWSVKRRASSFAIRI